MSGMTGDLVKNDRLNCEMCDRKDANTYSLMGGVFANLCPFHRTRLHFYMTTELPMTGYNEAFQARTNAIHEGKATPNSLYDWLDFELEIHEGTSKFIYGKDE